MEKLYAAYGSNLNLIQMTNRCPYAKVYAQSILNNWELVYRGSKTNSHATIRRKQGSLVPILIWHIHPLDEYYLDIYEGYPRYYIKKNIMVDINGKKRSVMVYIMNKNQLPGKPSANYVKVIRQGYIDNNMDLSILEKSLHTNFVECT